MFACEYSNISFETRTRTVSHSHTLRLEQRGKGFEDTKEEKDTCAREKGKHTKKRARPLTQGKRRASSPNQMRATLRQ
ncbi:hypothetical protein LIA77_02726 [Sarocladium implicatum]|nr:hypothetical protein LIA77_02726 [Sarocladium implicatum]